MRNCKILQLLMRFHETIDISRNFSGIRFDFCEIAKYFVDFQFCFSIYKRWLQNFGFFQTDSKFWSFKIGDDKS